MDLIVCIFFECVVWFLFLIDGPICNSKLVIYVLRYAAKIIYIKFVIERMKLIVLNLNIIKSIFKKNAKLIHGTWATFQRYTFNMYECTLFKFVLYKYRIMVYVDYIWKKIIISKIIVWMSLVRNSPTVRPLATLFSLHGS